MKLIAHIAVLLLLVSEALFGQVEPRENLGSAEKRAIVDAVCENLEREYIFPDITEQYVRLLRKNLESGIYDNIEDPSEFGQAVTGDLESIHRDRHLSVRFDPEWVRGERGRKELDQEAIERREWQNLTRNYGFREIEILDGNIGYLRLDSFSYDENAYAVAIGAMSVLANADALVIDLRSNGGGSPEMVQFLCSYLLENPRKHLNSFTYREEAKLTQYWTYTYLPGRRLVEADLWLLTSENTFSAAEEFAYNLKNLERAVIIGETTGGGAHDNKFIVLTDRFMMSLPFARALNPVTQANWEEVGVEPDVNVHQDLALKTALAMASRQLAERENPAHIKAYHEWHHEIYETALHPVTLDEAMLRSYVGIYGPRLITLENGSLVYQRGDRPKMKMKMATKIQEMILIPMSDNRFMFDENKNFRIRFVREDDRIIAVEGMNPGGVADRHEKNKP